MANIVDRFIGARTYDYDQLLLITLASMLIASKFEDIYPPTLFELIEDCKFDYTQEEILGMEGQILQALNFDLVVVTPLDAFEMIIQKKKIT